MKHIFICLTAMLLVACSTACKVAKNSPVNEIQFGHGGGVTQSVTRYIVKPDGRIYEGTEVIGKIDKKTVAHIYENAATIDCEPFNLPSNTFSFIRIVKKDTSLYYCWNGVAPLPIMDLNNKLYKSLPK